MFIFANIISLIALIGAFYVGFRVGRYFGRRD